MRVKRSKSLSQMWRFKSTKYCFSTDANKSFAKKLTKELAANDIQKLFEKFLCSKSVEFARKKSLKWKR